MAHLPNYFTWTYPGLGEHISGVVELGCGTGLAIPHCAERADVIYAVDRDPEVLGDVIRPAVIANGADDSSLVPPA
jgi:predicted RNA methylase